MGIILNVFYSKGQSGHRSRYSDVAMGWATKKTRDSISDRYKYAFSFPERPD